MEKNLQPQSEEEYVALWFSQLRDKLQAALTDSIQLVNPSEDLRRKLQIEIIGAQILCGRLREAIERDET